MEPDAASGGSTPRGFWRRVFSVEHLTGDVRAALIGSGTGSVVGIAASAIGAAFLAKAVVFTVYVNQDGVGQPRPLFDLAEKEDAKLRLQFTPAELRDVYVCEFKRVSGENYRTLVLKYLDSYRECFDVSARGDDSFVISANQRSSRIEQKKGAFLCECMASR
jgi:hypothetical protein